MLSKGGNWDRVFLFAAAISIGAGILGKLVLQPMRQRQIDRVNAAGKPDAS